MKKVKKISFSIIVTLVLIMSISMTVFAATASSSFVYKGKTIYYSLNVNWHDLTKDTGYAETYALTTYGGYPLGAYILAYDSSGNLLGGANKVSSSGSATTSTIKYNAAEFRSTHNIQDEDNVPQASRKLSLTE